jgi:hypothetical protein
VANLRASVALRAPFVPRFLKKRENKLRNSNLWSEKWGVLLWVPYHLFVQEPVYYHHSSSG